MGSALPDEFTVHDVGALTKTIGAAVADKVLTVLSGPADDVFAALARMKAENYRLPLAEGGGYAIDEFGSQGGRVWIRFRKT